MLPALIPAIVASLAPMLVRMATDSPRAAAITEKVAGAVLATTGAYASDAAAVGQALADPATAAALSQRLAEIEREEMQALLDDRANARSRDLEVRRIEGGGNRRADMLIVVVVALMVAAGVAMFWAPDEATRSLLAGAIGMLLKMLSDAFGFEFGSSRGSADKQRTIEAAIAGPAASDALAAWRAGR